MFFVVGDTRLGVGERERERELKREREGEKKLQHSEIIINFTKNLRERERKNYTKNPGSEVFSVWGKFFRAQQKEIFVTRKISFCFVLR